MLTLLFPTQTSLFVVDYFIYPVLPCPHCRLASLPEGYSRGYVIAILELGETRLIENSRFREAPDIELGAVATGETMGKYLTAVKSASWLKAPGYEMKGQGGCSPYN